MYRNKCDSVTKDSNQIPTLNMVVSSICMIIAIVWVFIMFNYVLIPHNVDVASIGYWVSLVPAMFMVVLGVVALNNSVVSNNYNNYWDLDDEDEEAFKQGW